MPKSQMKAALPIYGPKTYSQATTPSASEASDDEHVPKIREGFDSRFTKPPDVEDRLNAPLTDAEREQCLIDNAHLADLFLPSVRYRAEAHVNNSISREIVRELVIQNWKTQFVAANLLYRHTAKLRWSALGLWNKSWQFPHYPPNKGVDTADDPEFDAWQWPWQPDSDSGSTASKAYCLDLLRKAFHLRVGLRRNEPCHLPPRSHLSAAVTASEAEQFLISRPWIVFRLEVAEEETRRKRLTDLEQILYLSNYEPRDRVYGWWLYRGDWRFPESDSLQNPCFWKWRHESKTPEPEPAPQTISEPQQLSDQLTPSEVDISDRLEWPEKTDKYNLYGGPVWRRPYFAPVDASKVRFALPSEEPIPLIHRHYLASHARTLRSSVKREAINWDNVWDDSLEVIPEASPKPNPKPKAKAKPKARAKSKPKPKARAKPKTKARAKPKAKVKAKAKASPKSKASSNPKVNPNLVTAGFKTVSPATPANSSSKPRRQSARITELDKKRKRSVEEEVPPPKKIKSSQPNKAKLAKAKRNLQTS